ncbi:adenylate cyclase associated C terminal-domain-containing protein [Auriculariales sp. MPI-PUGE-AT-0066]|nr:adenylate cyclase associated C terminal-domain-containing protein [Auriculariales sp. MPI-PUGE-AT-0066]
MSSQQGPGLISLATIIKRLEAATSRLEDIALAQGQPLPNAGGEEEEEVPASVAAYDERILEGKVQPFVNAARHLHSTLSPIRTISSAAGESLGALNWFFIAPKPGPAINEVKDSAQFYWNRVIKDYKDKDQKHVDWARSLSSLLEELNKYVMEFHTTGVAWNPKGVPLAQYTPAAASGAPAAAAGGPPPPPPPPPPPAADLAAPAAAAGGPNAFLSEINRGTDVTKGLRKVDKSEMTHKNPELRASSIVPATSSAVAAKRPAKPSKPQSLQGKRPTKFVLEGNKWTIENYENDTSLVVDNAEMSHIVNIFGCKNVTVQIKGKVNAVNLLNCTKTSVLVESVISSVAVTRSPSFALQITGSAPTLQIDTTDSGQVYLSKACVAQNIEILTAKCSSINISLPEEGEEDGVFVERAVPEMLRTTIVGGQLKTEIVEHSG